MNIESLREYCLSFPSTSEDMAFGEDHLLIRVFGKIFACIDLERVDYLVLKCDSEYAVELRCTYSEIEPAWHWNKKYWIQIKLSGNVKENTIKSLIRHSYSEVVKKLPKKNRMENPEINEIH